MRLKWWILGLVVLGILLATFFLPERNGRPFSSDSEGVVWKGQKFGILVGESDRVNVANLKQLGWSYDHTEWGGGCIRHHYSPDYELMIFVDESWRHGTLCLISKEGRIRAIEWFYGPFWPEF